MIKAILFDLDMTLLDRDKLYRAFAEHLLRKVLPSDTDEEKIRAEVEHLVRTDAHGYEKKSNIYLPLIDKYQLSINLKEIIALWTDFTMTHAEAYPAAFTVLEELSGRYKLGLITNGEDSIQGNKILSSGISHYFDAITISGAEGIHKPSPEIFRLTLDRMGISSDEAVYVGDHWVNDITGALGAGMLAVWIQKEVDRELPQGVIAIGEVEELPEALKLLDETLPEQWPDELVRWHNLKARDLPWRRAKDPYSVWISEIMLQQTRVEAVIGYFEAFMKKFSDICALASAKEDEVLKAWEGLGYYTRARNLHKAAKVIVERFEGHFPEEYESIRALPGIGEYTAGAISALAFDQCRPAVDGNVLRILSRLYAVPDDVTSNSVKKKLTALISGHIPDQAAAAFTEGLMDLGQEICIPGSPRCERCPIRTYCRAFEMGQQQKLPVRKPKKKQREEERTVFIVWKDHKVLLCQRPDHTVLGGLWEFPGVDGKGELPLWEKTFGIPVPSDITEAFTCEHTFTHIHWTMHVYEIETLMEHPVTDRAWMWADPAGSSGVMLPTAFRKIREYAEDKSMNSNKNKGFRKTDA